MKANNNRFGKVEIISKTKTGISFRTETGETKTVMMGFVKFYDNDGVEITDFSEVENEVIVNDYKTSKKVKDSKLAKIVSGINEFSGTSKKDILDFMID